MSSTALKRTDAEIDDLLNRAVEGQDQGTKWPGMSYEDGICAAVDWLLGHHDQHPMDED